MKDFRLFDIMDFVMDEDFIRWVHHKSTDDNLFWQNWLALHPEKHLLIAEATRILECVKIEDRPISEDVVADEIKKLLNTISQPEPAENRLNLSPSCSKPAFTSFVRTWWWQAAAVILIAGSLTWYFLSRDNHHGKVAGNFAYTSITSSRHLVEHSNTSTRPIIIDLPDGSHIKLASNSRVSYSNRFDSNATRDVYLSGEALFDVSKNPAKPFRVYANEIVTKVLGTSFMVRSFEKDSTIQVIVRSGKVSVYSQATGNTREIAAPNKLGGIILTPNQQLVYEKEGQTFLKILLENPVMVTPAIVEKNSAYEDVPLEKVFAQLAKDYGINIVYDSEIVKNCTVTADLTKESFYNKLDLICKAVGAKYEVIDGQVVVQAGGCQ